MRNARFLILFLFAGLLLLGAQAKSSTFFDIRMQQARKALTGEHKDTEKAKKLLLDVVKSVWGEDPEKLVWANIYLGYLEARASACVSTYSRMFVSLPFRTVMAKTHSSSNAPDPEGIINQGHGNSAARAIQVYQGDPINKRALLNLFKAVIANNRAGGWRRLRSDG